MSTPAPRPPTRFGYKAAVVVALGFGGFAAWPYISTAAERLSQGKAVNAGEVNKEVEKAEREKEKKEKGFEPKSVLAMADGSALVGGKQGLMEWRDGKLTPVAGFTGMEVRGLAVTKDGSLYAAAKDGLWKRSGSEWKSVREGDYWGVSVAPDSALLVAGKMGVLRSSDGTQWEPLKGTETGWKPEAKHEEHGKKEGKPEKEKH